MKHSLLALALAATASPAAAQLDLARIWSDPVFQKQFVAGYGVNAEIEPRMSPDEITALQKLVPLMGTDLPKAEAALKKLIEPKSSATLDFNLGLIQAQQEKTAEAIETLERATKKFPSFRRAWQHLGALQLRSGDTDAAIRSYTKMIELGGGDAASYGLLGIAYFSKQDYQPAESAYRQALLLQPEYSQWRLGLVGCVLRQGKFDDAAALLDALIARAPGNAEYWLLQAEAHIGRKQPLRAAEYLEIVDRLGASTAESLRRLGNIYVTESLPDLAARAYGRALERDLKQPPARVIQDVEALAARGGATQARDLAARVRAAYGESMPDDDRKRLLKLQARLAMEHGDGDEQTAAVLEEVIRIDPLDGDALLLLGRYHAARRAHDQAIFYFERAASLEAFEARAKVHHAKSLLDLDRAAEALPLLRRAQEIKPREDMARWIEQVERTVRSKR